MALWSIQIFTGKEAAQSGQTLPPQPSPLPNTAAIRPAFWQDLAKLALSFAILPPAAFLIVMLFVMGYLKALPFFTLADILSYAPETYLLDGMVLVAFWLIRGYKTPINHLRYWVGIIFVVGLLVPVGCGLYAAFFSNNYQVSLTGENTQISADQVFPTSRGLLLIKNTEKGMYFIPWAQIRQLNTNPDKGCKTAAAGTQR